MMMVVRTELDPNLLVSGIRQAVRELDPDLPATEMRSLSGGQGGSDASSHRAAGGLKGRRTVTPSTALRRLAAPHLSRFSIRWKGVWTRSAA